MTLFDQQTDVLPSPQPEETTDPPRSGMRLLLVLVVPILLSLVVIGVVTAEVVARAEEQRTIAADFRSALSLADGERVEVDIAGSALVQGIVGRFDSVAVTVYSFPTGPANADLQFRAEGLQRVDNEWAADRVSGEMSFSAAQATALVRPAEARTAMRVGFSGGDMVFTAPSGGAAPASVSVAVTPRFENGRMSAALSTVTVDDKTLTADEAAAQAGIDLAALQPAPVCLAETMPRYLKVRDVRVSEGRFRLDVDIDLPAAVTPAGHRLGSCS